MYTVSIEVNEPQITASTTEANITVSSDNSLFTVTNQVSNFTVVNNSPEITFTADGGNGFDFTSKYRGEWVSGTSYTRNDVVRYAYSTYISNIDWGDVYSSSTPPPEDTGHWELFIYNEWPMASLTVNGTSYLNGYVVVTGPELINNNLLTTNRLVSSSTATFGGNISVAATITNIGGSINNIGGSILGVTNVGVRGTVTATNLTIGARPYPHEPTRDGPGTFTVNGIQYPRNPGIYGQVLYTNGDDRAAWVNLGELVLWDLSSDLLTNGFNIVSGQGFYYPYTTPQITIGQGPVEQGDNPAAFRQYIKLNESNDTTQGGIEIKGNTLFKDSQLNIENGIIVRGSTIDEPYDQTAISVTGNILVSNSITTRGLITDSLESGSASSCTPPNESPSSDYLKINGRITGGLIINVNPTEAFPGRVPGLTGFINPTGATANIPVLPGFIFPDGSILTSTNNLSFTLPIASASVLGGIKVGANLSINSSTGVLSATATLTTATTSTLGGIVVGDYLSINSSTGVLSVNTASLASLSYVLPIATESVLGGVTVGTTLNINTTTGLLNVDTATSSTIGVVVPGDFLTINGSGRISVDADALLEYVTTGSVGIATTTTLGLVKIGDTLNINTTTGVLNADIATTASVGLVRIGNGINVTTTGTISIAGPLGASGLTGDLYTNGYRIRNGNSKIFIENSSTTLETDRTVLGNDIYNSFLQVSQIYNYSGTGPPFFPAGVQYQDSTVQRTAWRGYDQGLI